MDLPTLTVRSGADHGRLVLHGAVDQTGGGDELVMRVEVSGTGLAAATTAIISRYDSPPLIDFLDEIAAAWQGWPGTRRWDGSDGALRIDASHDGWGHVTLRVTVAPTDTGHHIAWFATVVIQLEAGEEMSGLAAGIRSHLSRAA